MSEAAADYTDDQLEEVWSWIHNEQRCVTNQTVSLQLGLPRTVASSLLKALPTKFPQSNYEFTHLKMVTSKSAEEGAPKKTVIKMIKTKDMDDLANGLLYSLSLSNEKVETAHERDMATIKEDPERLLNSNTNMEIHCHTISPSHDDNIPLRLDMESSRQLRISGSSMKSTQNVSTTISTSSALSHKSTKVAPRKTTTAASFFGNNQNSSTMSKKKGMVSSQQKKTKRPTTTKAVKPKTKDTTPTDNTIMDIDTSKYNDEENANEEEDSSSPRKKTKYQKKSSPQEEEKENVINVKKSSKSVSKTPQKTKTNNNNNNNNNSTTQNTVGTADDFVGDEDEDDDFEKSEQQRRQRVKQVEKRRTAQMVANEEKVRQAKQHQQRSLTTKEEPDCNSENIIKVVGAMDAFAATTSKPSSQSSSQEISRSTRKRRKKLVDKTTMDSNGYIHTETVTEWEDVPEEELVAASEQRTKPIVTAAIAKKKKVTSTKHMKQAGLMGFFQKKK